jgi:hypothetical protein
MFHQIRFYFRKSWFGIEKFVICETAWGRIQHEGLFIYHGNRTPQLMRGIQTPKTVAANIGTWNPLF